MKVLVTGGSGFLGPHICRLLVKAGHDVVSFDLRRPPAEQEPTVRHVSGDVTSYESLRSCMETERVDWVVAAAAKILGDEADPLGTFRVNVLGLANVLEAARKTGAKKVVFTSTAGVYGARRDSPVLEEDLGMAPADTYEHTKAVAEGWVSAYRARFSLDARVVRFPFLYGPGQYLVWPLNIVLYHAVVGTRLDLPTGGDYSLEYLHVSDAAAGTVKALAAESIPEHTFNIGTGRCVTVREIAAIAKGLFPAFEFEIGPGLWKSDLMNSWLRSPLDTRRAEATLGFRPSFDIREGMADLALWASSHPEELNMWPRNDLWLL